MPHTKKKVSKKQTGSNAIKSIVVADEWLSSPQAYGDILKLAEHPFGKAGENELAWLRYNGYLQQQVDKGLFDMSFTLRQLYLPLRGSYAIKNAVATDQREETRYRFSGKSKNLLLVRDMLHSRAVVDLQEELDRWIESAKANDAIRLIHGGPGSGKSSFLKMFAAYRAELSDSPRVLFLPLHLLDHKGDLINEIGVYLRDTNHLPYNPIDPDSQRERLLLIFDGLDELALQGKVGAEAANSFVRQVILKLSMRNGNGMQIQAILSGRDVAVQSCAEMFQSEGQLLAVEPYVITTSNEEDDEEDDETIILEETIKKPIQDQRDLWWKKYHELKDGNARFSKSAQQKQNNGDQSNIPSELRNNAKLDEITKWPLLNHLVALSYEAGLRDFSNINRVYNKLLDDVYERAYEPRNSSARHKSLSNLKKKDFFRILEEIALAAWHGRGRTTTVEEITKHCDDAGLSALFRQFQPDQTEGKVAQLLLAFYFQRAGTLSDGNAAYEFTHKSFGEYLTACRLVRGIEKIHKEVHDHHENADDGWDSKRALIHWIELCGPSAIDLYLLEFLKDEVKLRDSDFNNWQSTLLQLFNYSLKNGLPIEDTNIAKGGTFNEISQQVRNSMEGLLCAIHACTVAVPEPEPVVVSWPNAYSAHSLIKFIYGESDGEENSVTECLAYFVMTKCLLSGLLISSGDLQGVNLAGAEMHRANLWQCKLHGANLQSANLRGSFLYGTKLVRANLNNAKLTGACLSMSALTEASLRKAKMGRADLRGASMRNADLTEAVLIGADLRGANLEGAVLTNAKMQKALLKDAILTGVNLDEVDLTQVDFDTKYSPIPEEEPIDLDAEELIDEEQNEI